MSSVSCAAFGKGQFESGVAAKALREFAQDPFPYLDGEKEHDHGAFGVVAEIH